MLEADVGLGGEHHAGGVGQARQQHRGLGQHRFERPALTARRDLGLDRPAVLLGQIADLHQRVDEEAQPELGRQPSCRGVRRIDQPELLEIRHDVAHRGGGERHRDQAREIARADGLAGRQITLDDAAKDLARPLIELAQADLGRADRHVVEDRTNLAHGATELSIRHAEFKSPSVQGEAGVEHLPGSVRPGLPVSLAATETRPSSSCR